MSIDSLYTANIPQYQRILYHDVIIAEQNKITKCLSDSVSVCLKFLGNSFPVLFQQTDVFLYGGHISKRDFLKKNSLHLTLNSIFSADSIQTTKN